MAAQIVKDIQQAWRQERRLLTTLNTAILGSVAAFSGSIGLILAGSVGAAITFCTGAAVDALFSGAVVADAVRGIRAKRPAAAKVKAPEQRNE
jgi:hypothetical protein